MFSFIPRKYCIVDLKDQTELSLVDPMQIRKIAQVLVIDDEEVQSGMPMVDYLRKHGFQNVQYYNALERIEDVAKFDIVLCDIQGVGESLKYTNGLELANDLKNLYPTIGIIAFSANTGKFDCRNIDGVFSKDAKASERNVIIDCVAKKVFNPIEVWKIFRDQLLSHDVSIHTVARLESVYTQKRINKEPLTMDDITKIIKDISAVTTIAAHLVKLSGMAGE